MCNHECMKFRVRISAFFFLLYCLTATIPAAAQTIPPTMTGWAPISPADLAANTPAVDPEAGVEALFWRVYVADEFRGDELIRVLHHYVRLKVFNEKGKSDASTIDIRFDKDTQIPFLYGRTIKRDGSIVELKRDAVFERDIERAGRLKYRAKSFAMPGVEPGAIVEYRWQEVRNHPRIHYFRLEFQREFPVRKVTYFLKPLSRQDTGYGMALWPFNCQPSHFQLEPDGSNSVFLDNVAAYKDEPMMPGDSNVRPWGLVFYSKDQKREPQKYWGDTGKLVYRNLREALKVNDEIKTAATTATQSSKNEEEKVLALIRYLRANMRNLFGSSVSGGERAQILKKMPKNRDRTSAEVMKSGIGTSDELNTLFAAMASHVGLDARPILLPDRSEIRFDPGMTDAYFLTSIDMAVKIGDHWKIYDVSRTLLAPDMISWTEEGVAALLADPKQPVFLATPVSPPGASKRIRKGRLSLAASGSLEGDLSQTFTGHAAEDRRRGLFTESPERQVELVKQEITKVFPQAEVTAIKVENAGDPEKDLAISYHIKVPNYAERTGKRLFFQPVFFERGSTPLFAAATRRYNIQFRYAFEEQDDVTIVIPGGFQLEEPENPGNLPFGKPGHYGLEMSIRGQEFKCHRELVFGDNAALEFDKSVYPQLKVIFDQVHRRDNQTLSLRQEAAQSGAQ